MHSVSMCTFIFNPNTLLNRTAKMTLRASVVSAVERDITLTQLRGNAWSANVLSAMEPTSKSNMCEEKNTMYVEFT